MIAFLKSLIPSSKKFWLSLQSLAVTVFIGGLWFLTAIVSYWSFLDTTPAFVASTYQDEQVVHAGDVATFRSSVDWLRACDLRTERHLINKENGQDTLIAEQNISITKNMIGKTDREYYIVVFIPNNMPPGSYWFERRTAVSCNPMQKMFPMTFVSTRQSVEIK